MTNLVQHPYAPPDDSWPVLGLSWEDIDLAFFRDAFCVKANDWDDHATGASGDLQNLIALKFVAPAPPHYCTLAGCLLLTDRAADYIEAARVSYVHFDGLNAMSAIIERADIRGRTDQLIADAIALTSTHSITIPSKVVELMLSNAVANRDYINSTDPIRIHSFADRIEITSPGGPSAAVTIKTFGEPGITSYRNPVLAEGMKALGLGNRWGVGIALARRLCAENGNPPLKFDVTQAYVRAIVPSAQRP